MHPLRLIIFFAVALLAMASQAVPAGNAPWGMYVRGIVCDSATTAPIARASVQTLPSRRGAVCDERGIFAVTFQPGDTAIRVSAMGFEPSVIPVKRTSHNLVAVYLRPAVTELAELTVHRKKYSKKGNPAVDFVRRLRAARGQADPYAKDFYSFDRYDRISTAIAGIDTASGNAVMRKYPFLKDHVDTSEVSGRPIIHVSVKEKSSTVTHRRQPQALKTTVNGLTSTGIEDFDPDDNLRTYLEDILREVNLYDRDITMLQRRFVSPLSPLAPDFYKFYLTDTAVVGGDTCAVLSFYPMNRATAGFTGHLYASTQDSAMTVRRVELGLAPEVNINFVHGFRLMQTFDKASDGTALKISDELTVELALVAGTPGIYVRRNSSYSRHSFDRPADMSVFESVGDVTVTDSAGCRPDSFWQQARLSPMSRQEGSVGDMSSRLHQSKLFHYGYRVVAAFVNGYVPLGDKFDYGPVNTTVSFNPVEGTRLRAGGLTTASLDKRWFGRGYVAWGSRDHKWKYRAEAEYSFIDKRHHSREFPVRSLRLSHIYDIDYIGQHYRHTNADNVFLSLKRMTDRRAIYHRVTELLYTLELRNNFSLAASLRSQRREATPWVPFVDANGYPLSHFTENSVGITLRYAPGEKFYQTRSSRFPVNRDALVISLTHVFAPAAWSRYPLSKTELSVEKRFWLSAFGHIDMQLDAARVWSRSPFTDLIIPDANLSYTIQRGSFALLNPMEAINDSQLSWFARYSADGLLFDRIPLLKKAHLREVVTYSGFWGRLDSRNRPCPGNGLLLFPQGAALMDMHRGAYGEISAGIDNIFRCLRVDYVWRLAYRNTPYPIDRSGVRIAFHASF